MTGYQFGAQQRGRRQATADRRHRAHPSRRYRKQPDHVPAWQARRHGFAAAHGGLWGIGDGLPEAICQK
ncbi:hypothetical protein D8L93_09470, partial [Sodalis-like symbiont of Bactericera trigonica]